MFTSLAPSPIANVILSVLSFMSLTTSAFYFGVALQTITESQTIAAFRKSYLKAGLKISSNAVPSIIIAIF